MSNEKKFVVWVNVKMEDPDLVAGLDKLATEDDSDRSKMVRKLIRQEIARRQQLSMLPMPLPTSTNKQSRAVAAV